MKNFFLNLKLRNKLFLLLLIPLIGLIYFSVYAVKEKLTLANNMEQMEQLTKLASSINDPIHELQIERGVSSVYLTSQGEKMGEELSQRRLNTDREIKKLNLFLKNNNFKYNTELKNSLNNVIDELGKLSEKRKAVYDKKISVKIAFSFYTKIIVSLTEVTNNIIEIMSNYGDAKIHQFLSAYVNFIQAKERAGQERALLAGILLKRQFDSDTYRSFISLIAAQNAYFDVFMTYASPRQKSIYTTKLQNRFTDEVEKIRKAVLSKGVGVNLNIDSIYWFNTSTGKIDLLKVIKNEIIADMSVYSQKEEQKANAVVWFYLISTCVIIAAALIFSLLIIRNVGRSIANIVYAADKIANGDLTQMINSEGNNEIGKLGSSLNLMVGNLKKSLLKTNEKIENINSLPSSVITIDKKYNITYMNRAGSNLTGISSTEAIGKKCYDLFKTDHCNTDLCACRQAMEKDNTVTEEAISNPSGNSIDIRYTGTPVKNEDGSIKGALEFFIDISAEKALSQTIIEGAEKLSATITEITSTISQLAANSTEISSAINEITTTVTEVKQVSEVAHERAVEVTERAEQVNTTTDIGKKATEDTIYGILKIKEEMASIAESTIKLGEQTQNIGEIISSVNGLADQSNLLSVNASIEAAKAGEYGKGFAVVAREVKALADQSKSATKQINSILTDIQKATSSAVMATERGTNAVASGQELSATAGETITLLAEG
ncbi:MAG: PAS domain-containing protein, partial [bacterium]|nr:PAS domain-containing protein [bacterium]